MHPFDESLAREVRAPTSAKASAFASADKSAGKHARAKFNYRARVGYYFVILFNIKLSYQQKQFLFIPVLPTYDFSPTIYIPWLENRKLARQGYHMFFDDNFILCYIGRAVKAVLYVFSQHSRSGGAEPTGGNIKGVFNPNLS